ncbi:hypothetical protein AMEX_G5864 [Astyanax mexicanus]|uniref:C2H2-type domain-containing protein n=1 Tax=Astyanax mexicanus TaxID=7994 RepID=A0A8T2M234_ASTMX|nr:hypothetical protein AMEX_G5864 [Astyanax mexicanus]
MAWNCKLCIVSLDTRAKLLMHYRLQHSHYSRISPLPCLYADCICTFHSFTALKAHLSRSHKNVGRLETEEAAHVFFSCHMCTCKQPFSEEALFGHLRSHLRKHEMVPCPFKNCNYRTNVYSSFNAHKSRKHMGSSDYDDSVVSAESGSAPATSSADCDEGPTQCESSGSLDLLEVESQCDAGNLRAELQRNLASLFLKMQTVLHVSNMATQEIIEHLSQIFALSQPLIKKTISDVLQSFDVPVTEASIEQVVSAVMDSNILTSSTAEGQDLSSAKRRKTYVEKNFPVVVPTQYVLEPGHTVVHVSILEMIQEMFRHTDILDKVKETTSPPKGHYVSHQDGSYFKDNELLSFSEDLTLPLILYTDDLEIANPLGTSRKIHKLSAVYWVLADLPVKYRSSLHVIQLATLCKVSDIQKFGYERVLAPLLKDLCTLEEDGVFIESIGKAVRGTVMCVVSDNLAAHSLAGFTKSFRAKYFCRFCKATQDQMHTCEVGSGEFCLRTKASHDFDVHAVTHGESQDQCGVQGDCVLNQRLKHFHTVTGFPPDVLHDLLEGIVPVELALCIGEMIRCKYFTHEYLNKRILSFPYQHADNVDKPKPIPKTFTVKNTIGGNGHENSTLLRLLPLIIGDKIPEGDGAWAVLMDLKEIVELGLSLTFTEETIQYLQTKIQDHRRMLLEVFPRFSLRPKHHYLEHYPDLIRCFGPVVQLWTMRFEGKHRFFKRVVQDTQNFKNVLNTLATRHQHMVAYHLSAPSFFKPHQQTSKVSSVMVSMLPDSAKAYIVQKTGSSMIYSTSRVNIDGTDYDVGMFVSVGQVGELPLFCKIEQIFLVNTEVVFLCQKHTSHYIEHLRSYELFPGSLTVHTVSQLNDQLPLSAYNTQGRLLITPKRYILV